ncbi:NADH dehydrogenase [ubiquinone] 1 alpha subcomplex subunit 8-B [Bienertia sinuspersici]
MAANASTAEPIPTSAVLMASSKHINIKCRDENVAFLKCKQKDPNPEKCLDKGQQVTRCVLSFLGDDCVDWKFRHIQKRVAFLLKFGALRSLDIGLGDASGVMDRGIEMNQCFDWDVKLEKLESSGLIPLLKDLHQKCTKEMDSYSSCMYYHTNEFELCRKEQEEFEKACPLE